MTRSNSCCVTSSDLTRLWSHGPFAALRTRASPRTCSRGELHPRDCGRWRDPCRRQGAALSGRGLRSPCPSNGPQEGAAVDDWPLGLRRARAVLHGSRAGDRRVGSGGRQPFCRLAFRAVPDAARGADVRPSAVVGGGREGRPAPQPGANGGEQHRLRRSPGLQQLRVLRLLRLPHSRQGRPGGAADQGDGHRAG